MNDTPKLLPVHSCQAHDGAITSMTVGPNTGLVFASAGADKILNLWAIGKDSPCACFKNLNSYVTSMEFQNTEEIIACGTNGGSVMLFDIAAEKTMASWAVSASKIGGLTFDSSNMETIATCGVDGRVQILAQKCHAPVSIFNVSQDELTTITLSPDGRYFAAGGLDKVVNIYDLRSNQILAYHELHQDAVTALQFHPTENILASGGKDRSIHFFSLDTFTEIEPVLQKNTAEIASIRWHPKGSTALSVSKSLLNVVGVNPNQVYDRFKYSLGSVYDTQIVGGNIVIASAMSNHISLNRVKLDTLQPYSPYSKKSVARKSDVSSVSPSKSPIRRSSTPTSFKCDENKVYAEFRRERPEFCTQMTERGSRIARLGDMIEESGLEQTIETVASGGDLQPEMASIILRRPKSIKLESAAPVMIIANKLFETQPDVALTLIDSIMTTFGKITFATMRTNGADASLEERKARCEEMLDAYRLNLPEIQKLSQFKNPLKKAADDLLLQWRSFS
ncbi:hypothetical protein TVAG_363890 [Trichomonas vaginalis G3]|uniref:Katanin p80 subunit C-terminal domain-containing protein n=1 Tax=Trichomonas vaginalis (strain ATCC PRA-98 / G3) TaxID=412133 RepID=A2EDV8_TRIV3|nr:microtubule severing [Trichomonas vaginalis G3]EAY09174.1 hypothetical protein TVAG_363890 [Trichomonas vaginalis G3]KAI5487038.1 microtubule severing [Trichomonas vaginalis G3]|eukprot:XP_001321397.1 hypothetical protein [Trichomonas vaginalis G3]